MNDTKKKIGILTLISYNYGNRLQNYALQVVLLEMGFYVETILRDRENFIELFKRKLRNYIIKDRYTAFNRFNDEIIWSKYVIAKDYTSKNIDSRYDYFIVGSDQIWNPRIRTLDLSVYLPCVPSEKKLAYAASFGTTEITSEEISTIINNIGSFKSVSCREYEGTALINSYFQNKAVTVLDPVFLLSADRWRTIYRKPNKMKGYRYLLRYCLGNSDYNEYVNQLAKRNNLQIIDVNRDYSWLDPREFLFLVDNAEIMCTDSFHGAAFSCIFGTKIKVLKRIDQKEDMSCRLDSLCRILNINPELFFYHENSMNNNVFYDMQEIQYNIIRERKKSMAFLENALKGYCL